MYMYIFVCESKMVPIKINKHFNLDIPISDKLNSVCRTCLLSCDNLESIFSLTLVDGKYEQISNMIALCTGVEISAYDTFTNLICKLCIESTINAYNYRKQCWTSHQEFLRRAEEAQASKQKDIQQKLQLQNFEEFEMVELSDLIETKSEKVVQRPIKIAKLEIPKAYNDMIDYIKVDDASPAQPFSCSLCQSTYKFLTRLRMHLIKRHYINFITKFQCETCSQYFTHAIFLQRHRQIHQPNSLSLTCDQCGKQFRKHNVLLEHMRRHTGEKPFKCDLCDFCTVNRGDLTIHRRWHTGDRPFKCHLCPLTYQTSSHLADHMRKHSHERPFKCEICSTSYKSRKVYKSHMNTHDPANTVECPECQKMFTAHKYLSKHMKIHRSIIYECAECEETFTRNQDYRNHSKRVHNIVIAKNF